MDHKLRSRPAGQQLSIFTNQTARRGLCRVRCHRGHWLSAPTPPGLSGHTRGDNCDNMETARFKHSSSKGKGSWCVQVDLKQGRTPLWRTFLPVFSPGTLRLRRQAASAPYPGLHGGWRDRTREGLAQPPNPERSPGQATWCRWKRRPGMATRVLFRHFYKEARG